MGFFDRFKKDKGIELTAPMKGKCVSIKEVPDPTFAEEILGKGIAVIPQDGHVYAPADGKISTVFPTGHAVGITTADGAEISVTLYTKLSFVFIAIGLSFPKANSRTNTLFLVVSILSSSIFIPFL